MRPAIHSPQAPQPNPPPNLPPPDKPLVQQQQSPTPTPSMIFTEASETTTTSAKTMPPALRPLPPGFREHETGYNSKSLGIGVGRENESKIIASHKPSSGYYDIQSMQIESSMTSNNMKIIPSGYDNAVLEPKPQVQTFSSSLPTSIEPSGYDTTKSNAKLNFQNPPVIINPNVAVENTLSLSTPSLIIYEKKSAAVNQNIGYENKNQAVENFNVMSTTQPPSHEPPSVEVNQNIGYENQNQAVENFNDITSTLLPPYESPSFGVNRGRPSEQPLSNVYDIGSTQQYQRYQSPGISPTIMELASPRPFKNEGVDMPVLTQTWNGYMAPNLGVIQPTASSSSNGYDAPSLGVEKPNSIVPPNGYESPSLGNSIIVRLIKK